MSRWVTGSEMVPNIYGNSVHYKGSISNLYVKKMDYSVYNVGTTGWSSGEKNKIELIHHTLPQNKF